MRKGGLVVIIFFKLREESFKPHFFRFCGELDRGSVALEGMLAQGPRVLSPIVTLRHGISRQGSLPPANKACHLLS